MSEPVEVITEVLRQHQQADEYGLPVEECRGCGWPRTKADYETPDHAAHVAEAVAEALQLTEEVNRYSGFTAPRNGGTPRLRRFVTPWVAVDGSPQP